jgi:hypothetical protein
VRRADLAVLPASTFRRSPSRCADEGLLTRKNGVTESFPRIVIRRGGCGDPARKRTSLYLVPLHRATEHHLRLAVPVSNGWPADSSLAPGKQREEGGRAAMQAESKSRGRCQASATDLDLDRLTPSEWGRLRRPRVKRLGRFARVRTRADRIAMAAGRFERAVALLCCVAPRAAPVYKRHDTRLSFTGMMTVSPLSAGGRPSIDETS